MSPNCKVSFAVGFSTTTSIACNAGMEAVFVICRWDCRTLPSLYSSFETIVNMGAELVDNLKQPKDILINPR